MTIKYDIELLKTFVDKTASLDDWPNVKEAIDRIEATLTPNADRQAALESAQWLDNCAEGMEEEGLDRENNARHFRAGARYIRAALQTPCVPVIEGLEEDIKALDYVHGEYSAGCIDRSDVNRAYEVCGRLSKIMQAARWVDEQNKERG